MFNKQSIVTKVSSIFLICSTLIVGLIFGYNYWYSRNTIVEMALDKGQTLGREVAESVAAELKPVEAVVQNIAVALENEDITTSEMTILLNRLISKTRTVYGMAIAFEPYKMEAEREFYAPYSFKDVTGVQQKMLGGSDYNYFLMDWYQIPKELGKPYWTEPYFDTEGGNALMVTYAVPFYRLVDGKHIFYGVVTADIALDWLSEKMAGLKLYENGYPVLYSQNGTVIYHPNEKMIANETIFSYAERFDDQRLWDIGRAMIDGETGVVEYNSNYSGLEIYFLYLPSKVGNWSIGLLLPKNEMLSKLSEVTKNTIIISVLGFLLLALTIISITRKVTKPIIALSQSTKDIAAGNLEAELPVYTAKDELGQLTESFRQMELSLQQYIDELTATTISKERIESELRIARDIQMGILPKLFPAFPERSEFDIFASIEPAKEVGGDLYDFFFLDDDHFCFLIGDVSGKGVPAAFFMAVTKTMLNIVSEQKKDPGQILVKVNDDLAKDNDACMFVTLFLGVLNIKTGHVRYASAGHNPPVLLAQDEVSWLHVPREPVAGAMDGMTYSTCEVDLQKGDTLFLYTDGVTEAMNEEDELYSDPRLLNLLTAAGEKRPEQLVKNVSDSVADFAGEAEQSDDITMLAIQFADKGEEG